MLPFQEPTDTSDSSYMDPSTAAIEIKAIVRYDYIAKSATELTLKVGDTIRNIVKFDNGWWQGDLGQQKAGIFPCNCVDEIIDDEVKLVNSFAINYLLTMLVQDDEEEPKPRSIDLDNEYISVTMGPDCTFSIGVFNFKAASEEDQEAWINSIRDVINSNKDKVWLSVFTLLTLLFTVVTHHQQTLPSEWEKAMKSSLKIAPELNRLVHYCIATAYRGRRYFLLV